MVATMKFLFMILAAFLPVKLSYSFRSTKYVVHQGLALFTVPSIFDVYDHDAQESELDIELPSILYLESHKAALATKEDRRCHFEGETECSHKISGICPIDGRPCSANRCFLRNKRSKYSHARDGDDGDKPKTEGTINTNTNNKEKKSNNQKQMEYNDDLLKKQIRQQKQRIADLQQAQELKHEQQQQERASRLDKNGNFRKSHKNRGVVSSGFSFTGKKRSKPSTTTPIHMKRDNTRNTRNEEPPTNSQDLKHLPQHRHDQGMSYHGYPLESFYDDFNAGDNENGMYAQFYEETGNNQVLDLIEHILPTEEQKDNTINAIVASCTVFTTFMTDVAKSFFRFAEEEEEEVEEEEE